jgi:hypothetical protein
MSLLRPAILGNGLSQRVDQPQGGQATTPATLIGRYPHAFPIGLPSAGASATVAENSTGSFSHPEESK